MDINAQGMPRYTPGLLVYFPGDGYYQYEDDGDGGRWVKLTDEAARAVWHARLVAAGLVSDEDAP